MVVGLTGGIACGKSTVANMFMKLGCVIIDADKVAREVVEPGEQGLEGVIRRFGKGILDEQGRLDRKALGNIVFSDEQARHDLNTILHPLIRQRMADKKEEARKQNPPFILMDIPLLYESNQVHTVEAVIVVYVPAHLQLKRLMERDQLTMQEAQQRIESQMPIEEKKQKADFIIDNSGTQADTLIQVQNLFNKLSKE